MVRATVSSDRRYAELNEFPYQVAISSVGRNSTTFCSGTVLAYNWVLTTATCIIRGSQYNLRFGSILHYTGGDAQTSFEAFVHPLYDSRKRMHDIGAIRLPTMLSLWGPIQAIRLPSNTQFNQRETFENFRANVTGWGWMTSNKYRPALAIEETRVLANSAFGCWNALIQAINATAIDDRYMCASTEFPTHHGCPGDLGSPLVIRESDGQLTQVGVALFGEENRVCNGQTQVYLRIQNYLTWIQQTTGVLIRV